VPVVFHSWDTIRTVVITLLFLNENSKTGMKNANTRVLDRIKNGYQMMAFIF